MATIIPVSVIIPTRNRASVLKKSLETYIIQGLHPQEIVIIDGSDNDETRNVSNANFKGLLSKIIYTKAEKLGAAVQRNQGIEVATQPYLLFADDDVYLEEHCVDRLWSAIQSAPDIGGVSAMITNQKYLPMGRVSSMVASVLFGRRLKSYAGKALVPGWGILPEDDENLPDVVPVEWLNLGATIYRREALPTPAFNSHFTGYSLAEDFSLSVTVSRKWRLMNARTARIYHDSQPGSHKKSAFKMGEMDFVNRHYIMTQVLQKRGMKNYFKLLFFQAFQLMSGVTSRSGLLSLPASAAGRFVGFVKIMFK